MSVESIEAKRGWLSNSGYNLILRSGVEMEDRGVLFSEKYKTEMVLKRGVIPLDTILSYEDLRPVRKKRNLTVEIGGMPLTGKDSMIAMINDLGKKYIFCGKEAYDSVRTWDKFRSCKEAEKRKYLFAAVMGQQISGMKELIDRGVGKGGIIFNNRSYFDRVTFDRAMFLHGEISIANYYDPMVRLSINSDIKIFTMVNPEVVMERKELNKREGDHLNCDFLSLLYDEYLAQTRKLFERGGTNIILLNASGTINQTYEKLRGVIRKITGVRL